MRRRLSRSIRSASCGDIGPQADDVKRMLRAVGASNLDQLINEAIPDDIRQAEP
jgi:glycine cleavage system pyridoxal-binding protein P